MLALTAAWPLLAQAASPPLADRGAVCTAAEPAATAAATRMPLLFGTAPAELLPEAAAIPGERASLTPLPASLGFRDHLDVVGRLRTLHSIPILRLWASRTSSLFLGVDRRGIYGLHFERRAPRDWGERARLRAPEPGSDLARLRLP